MKHYLFLILLTLPLFSSAQTETQIRTHYQDINKKITESKENGYEGSLYCNEWITNKNGKSWPTVGNYTETTEFWYSDDPSHPSVESNKLQVLQKINVLRKAASLTTHEEYLFLKGKLVFFFSSEGEEGNLWETRIYFNTKGMFKSIVKANGTELSAKDFLKEEYKDFKPAPAGVLAESKRLQDVFLKSM